MSLVVYQVCYCLYQVCYWCVYQEFCCVYQVCLRGVLLCSPVTVFTWCVSGFTCYCVFLGLPGVLLCLPVTVFTKCVSVFTRCVTLFTRCVTGVLLYLPGVLLVCYSIYQVCYWCVTLFTRCVTGVLLYLPGVLLACYLVFTSRMSADQAILFVRAKRPNSIQTRGQLLCVREFAQFLVPLRNVFSCAEPRANAVTLSQYLTRQRHLLHGYEARQMKNVPKIVQLVCKVLLDIAANRQVVVEEAVVEVPDLTAEVEKTVSQQAIQLLGKEMRGKGIPVPSPCLPCPRHETALTQPCPRPETALTQPCPHPETALTQPCPRPETALTQPCPRPQTALTHTLHMERPLTPNLALLQEPSLLLEPPLSPALAHDPVLSSDKELDPLWQRQNGVAASLLKPLHPGKRLLSYSDSALYKLDPRRDPDQEQNQNHIWSIPCGNPLTHHQLATAWEPPTSPSLPPQHHPFSMGEQTREERRGGQERSSKESDHHTQKNMSPLFQRRKQLCEGQRSLSFGFGGSLSKPSGEELSEGRPWRGDMPVMSLTGGEESVCGVDRAGDREERVRGKAGEREDREERKDREDRERLTEVPVITLYAELSLEARRLLVARALALGLNDEDLHYKVSVWQVRHDSLTDVVGKT
ncbi:unnamed protein product [Oncorhynchus mykiss]|uniref:Uncharacterized protein n=1 Tax=Oncorhynchus mykiss TaxID=8022 RepID=A0A060Z1E7_ONCMY|nr:unnamed protein product [Oncorhynchus mykiss]